MREPHPLFKPSYMISQIDDPAKKAQAAKNPLLFYLANPFAARPIALFDSEHYYAKYMNGSDENPLVHYLLTGSPLAHDPHPLFDTQYFYDQNPNADKAASALQAYLDTDPQ